MYLPYDSHVHTAMIWIAAGDWQIVDDLVMEYLRSKRLVDIASEDGEHISYRLNEAGERKLAEWNDG